MFYSIHKKVMFFFFIYIYPLTLVTHDLDVQSEILQLLSNNLQKKMYFVVLLGLFWYFKLLQVKTG